jgi:hypothetical protein
MPKNSDVKKLLGKEQIELAPSFSFFLFSSLSSHIKAADLKKA